MIVLSKWLFSHIDSVVSVGEHNDRSVDKVMNVIKSLHSMICYIMSPTINENIINEIDRHIKLFLSFIEILDLELREEREHENKKDPHIWITSYNFVCLLNLPQQIARFGPVNNYWEGGGLGEKYIQVGKKHFRNLRVIGVIIYYIK